MKLQRIRALSKKQVLIGAVAASFIAGGISAAVNSSPQTTGADTSPLTQEVDRQGQQLSNHEARITNTENDVKDLQNKTGTPPSTTKVYVPVPSSTTPTVTSTPNPTPATTPAAIPVKVVRVGMTINTSGDSHCDLFYSDGSTGTAPAIVTQNGGGGESDCNSYIGQAK